MDLAEEIREQDDLWLLRFAVPGRRQPEGVISLRHPGNSSFYCIGSRPLWSFVHQVLQQYFLAADCIDSLGDKQFRALSTSHLYAVLVTMARTFLHPLDPKIRHCIFNDLSKPKGPGLGFGRMRETYGFAFMSSDVADWTGL